MRRFAIILTVACFAVVSCRKAETPRAAAATQPAYEVSRTFGAGPVTFTVELSSAAITTAESVKCRLTLSAAQGYEAEFPDIALPEDVPGSIVTDYEEHTASEGDRQVVRRDYEFEPEYEGKLVLPKMEIYSHRSGEVKEEILETEPIEVTVKAMQEAPQDLELRPVRGLVTVEQMIAQERRAWPRIVVGLCVLVAAVAGIVYLGAAAAAAASAPAGARGRLAVCYGTWPAAGSRPRSSSRSSSRSPASSATTSNRRSACGPPSRRPRSSSRR